MNIKKLHIENFRGLSSYTYELSDTLTLFAGINGAGKSTVLAAVKILFSWLVARLKNSKGNGDSLTDSDVKIGQQYCLLQIDVEYNGQNVEWKLYRQLSSVRTKPVHQTVLKDLSELANRILLDNQNNTGAAALPLVASYGVNRLVANVGTELAKKSALNMLDVYNKDGGDNYTALFAWFREREDIENEQFRNTGSLEEDMQLKAVRHAIYGCLPGFSDLRSQRTSRIYTIKKNGIDFDLNQLSDGEKAYIALVADIARKLGMTHPNMPNPLMAEGIVMIDEIDLHLHPTWQREILPGLNKVFPNVQFLITTHSPYVLSNVNINKGEKLFLLDSGETSLVEANVYGKSIEQILLDELNVRSTRGMEVQNHLDAVNSCLKRKDISSEEYLGHKSWLKDNVSRSDSVFMNIVEQESLIKFRRHEKN